MSREPVAGQNGIHPKHRVGSSRGTGMIWGMIKTIIMELDRFVFGFGGPHGPIIKASCAVEVSERLGRLLQDQDLMAGDRAAGETEFTPQGLLCERPGPDGHGLLAGNPEWRTGLDKPKDLGILCFSESSLGSSPFCFIRRGWPPADWGSCGDSAQCRYLMRCT